MITVLREAGRVVRTTVFLLTAGAGRVVTTTLDL